MQKSPCLLRYGGFCIYTNQREGLIFIVQDPVNERCVALSVRATKLTGRVLAMAMQAAIRKMRQPGHKHGKQSLKSLSKTGADLENIEISEADIGSFKKVAKKYDIDFALKKDSSKNPPNWVVFFKAKNSKCLEMAFKEYSHEILKQKAPKPSMLKKLEAYKAIASAVSSPTKVHSKGEIAV